MNEDMDDKSIAYDIQQSSRAMPVCSIVRECVNSSRKNENEVINYLLFSLTNLIKMAKRESYRIQSIRSDFYETHYIFSFEFGSAVACICVHVGVYVCADICVVYLANYLICLKPINNFGDT